MKIQLSHPWLIAEFDHPLRTLSWSLNRPGFAMADRVVWREVRNADLPADLNAKDWFTKILEDAGHREAIGLITSRDVRRFVNAEKTCDGVIAKAASTVGLSNAERVGQRQAKTMAPAGTINTLVTVSARLSDAALIEAISIAAQAQTVAVLEHGPMLQGLGRATGTGTDCIVVAAAPGIEPHAGLHTPIGEAIGAAVLDAVGRGAADWMAERENGAAESH